MKRLAFVIVVAACSKSGEGVGTGSASASASVSADELRLAPMFDAAADRIAADLRAAAARPHRSRAGAAEELAAATPAGFYRYADVLAQFHVTPQELSKMAEQHPDVMGRLADRLTARIKAPMEAFTASLASLPATDPDDCVALVRRMIVVVRSKGPDHALAPVLVPAYYQCTPVLPPRAKDCMGAATAEQFDQCLSSR